MSRICALGVALVAQASARSFDWDRYMREYAGDYYKGSMNGEFSGDVQRYVKGYGADAKNFAQQYSQDRLAQAKQYQDKYEGQYAPASAEKMAQPVLLEAAAAGGANASDPVSQAVAARDSASQQAEASIGELRSWNAKLVEHLQDKTFASTVAQGIETKVETTFLQQKQGLQKKLRAAVQAADAEGADRAADELKNLDDEEASAMRKTLRSIQKAGMVKSRTLWKEARKAARQVYKEGMHGAKAQRRAGEAESVYEGSMLGAEESSERLLAQAEQAAEHSERLVEEQFDKVKLQLEVVSENLRRQTREFVHQAKTPATEGATAATEQQANPTVFLARASSQDLSAALIAPLACVAMFAAMTALLAARFCRGGVAMEHPLLG